MKRILLLSAALLALSLSRARAQDDDDDDAVPAKSKPVAAAVVKSSAAVLSELAKSTGPLSADQVIAGLEAADSSINTLHAKFTQGLRIPGYGVDQKGAGELWYKKEKLLRIEQSLPRKQTVVSDGTVLYIYAPDSNQLIEQDWSSFANSQMASRGLVQFGSYAHLRENYDVSVASAPDAGGRRAYRLTLKPKQAQEIPYTLELTVGPPDFIPRSTHMDLNDTEVSTDMSEVSVNPDLDPALFTFKVPAGVTVIHPGAAQTPP